MLAKLITNIAAYKFAPLTELKVLRDRLLTFCKTAGLRGTILLSTEGINLFVAGPAAEIDQLVSELRSISGLEELTPKYSDSDHQPFNRMLVRIKKEIIAFGVEGIDPSRHTSPKLPARVLKQWLDEGRPLTLLDTRNDYEVKLGTFKGARPAGIDHFRQFPDAVRQLPPELKDQPVVMFCTGGIRCEKAGPFMEREGFNQIYQLEGGILKYFEECGGAHYEGECFVFDQRVGVDPALQETDSAHCFACLAPLTVADQKDPRYSPPDSCPHCYKTSGDRMAETIARRHESIQRCTSPLPGSGAYDNRRPVNVPAASDGRTLVECLTGIFPHVPQDEWLRLCEAGRIVNPLGLPVCADQVVRAGQRYERISPGTVEPDVNAGITILHEDEAFVAVNKPAPLPMHPSGRFNRNTLQSILAEVYAPEKPRPVHRLDANTTGMVVLARSQRFARLIQPQFVRGEVDKRYLVRVPGHPVSDLFACDAPISTDPGVLGSREVDECEGQEAYTEFQVLSRDTDGTALLEARPRTGRTNQIRIHLWNLGFPICGDPAYLPGGKLGDAMTLPVGAQPLCLHAWKLGFVHPLTKTRVEFEAPAPEWARIAEIVS